MHPVIDVFGKPISAYVLINYYLGTFIPMLLYFLFLSRYSKKRDIEVSIPRLFCALVFIALASRIAGRFIYSMMYAPGAANVLSMRVGDGTILFAGYLGAMLALVVITRLSKRPTLFWLDASTIWLAFALGIRKIGCFLTGCCGGTETILPWGVVFPGSTVPVHPLQLYESIFGFAIAIYLWRGFMRRDMSDGSGFFLFLSLFSLLRLLTLPIRAIPVQANFVALGPIAFLVLAVASGAVYLRLTRTKQETPCFSHEGVKPGNEGI